MSKIEKIYKLIEKFAENESSYWHVEWINSRAFAVSDEAKRITFGYSYKKYDINIKGLDPEDREEMFSIQKDLYERMYGYEQLADEYEDNINFIENHRPEGYIIATDSNSVLDTDWEIGSIETYAWDISESQLDYFWNAGGFDMMCEEINGVAEHTDCYTYKGKRWYTVPKYDDVFFEYVFYDDDGDLEWEAYEGYGIYQVPEGESEKIVEIIANWKKSLEVASIPDFIWNEIKDDYSPEAIEELGIEWEMINEVSYNLTEDGKIYDLPLSEIKELVKYKVVKREGDDFFVEGFGGKKELPGFEKMIKKFGMEIKKTPIPGTSVETEAFVKYGEEYHVSWLMFLLDVYEEHFMSFDVSIKRAALERLKAIHNRLYSRYLNRLEIEEILREAENVCVTFEDSLKGGNCKPGTMTFIERHGINIQKVKCINGKELYEMAHPNEKRYVLNAIKAAISRRKAEDELDGNNN